jgi:hypothetical protein
MMISATDFIEAFHRQDLARKPYMRPGYKAIAEQSPAVMDHFMQNGMLELIASCQKFSFGNVDSIANELNPLRDTALDFYQNGIKVCPFSECWFEWNLKREHHDENIICFVEDLPDRMLFQVFFCDKVGPNRDLISWTFSGLVWFLTSSGDYNCYPCSEEIEQDSISDGVNIGDQFTIQLALASMAMLMARETKVVEKRPPAGINAHRLKKGRVPLFSHHVVTIDRERIVYEGGSDQPSGIKRSSPRLHWRRGHPRTLRSGKVIGVPPCIIGAKPRGDGDDGGGPGGSGPVIDKTYRVRL